MERGSLAGIAGALLLVCLAVPTGIDAPTEVTT